MMHSKRHLPDIEQRSQSSGSNVIPRRAQASHFQVFRKEWFAVDVDHVSEGSGGNQEEEDDTHPSVDGERHKGERPLCLCLSLSLCICLCICLSLALSLPRSLSLSPSLSLFHGRTHYLSVDGGRHKGERLLSLSLALSFFLSRSLSLRLALFLSRSPSLSLSRQGVPQRRRWRHRRTPSLSLSPSLSPSISLALSLSRSLGRTHHLSVDGGGHEGGGFLGLDVEEHPGLACLLLRDVDALVPPPAPGSSQFKNKIVLNLRTKLFSI